MSGTRRMTVSQAIVEFLAVQCMADDGGAKHRLVPWISGIFGHGNVAGIGEALQSAGGRLPYRQARNEQAMVHTAIGYARMRNRRAFIACTSSIGPGATNLVTGAATATINHIPVLLLPGDIFATRPAAPVLQQLEVPGTFDVSVNDTLRPVSRFWDRISRPEQLGASLLEAFRVLTDPSETGAVTIALPQDVQTQAFDFPTELFEERVWRVRRPVPEPHLVAKVADLVRQSRRPLIVAGGGVKYAHACGELADFVTSTGIPVIETFAGKGSLPFDHPANLGAAGHTGTPAARAFAARADLVIGLGTRWTDFTTASHTAFSAEGVRFVNVNVTPFDAGKLAGVPVVADARATLEQLGPALADYRVADDFREAAAQAMREWNGTVERLYAPGGTQRPTQAQVIGAVERAAGPRDVMVCAAGSLPGELHRLWRSRDPASFHVEYGYSCMGYEIAGGLGVRFAAPDREVFVLVGDGSYLMMSQEIVTAVQEHAKIIIVLVQNHGYASIGALSTSVGSAGFGTKYRYRNPETGDLDGDVLPVDLAANAASLGADIYRAHSLADLDVALEKARLGDRVAVVHVETDPAGQVPSSGSWWEVPVAEVSGTPSVRDARAEYEDLRRAQRPHFAPQPPSR